MNLITIESTTDLDAKFEHLAKAWTAHGEFWSVASCKETMLASLTFFSAAMEIDHSWCGWYLATKQGEDFELLFIYSAPHARGRGIGKQLLSDLIKKVRKNSAGAKIFLEVRSSNLIAIKLYEQMGFVKITTRSRYYSDGEDALGYQLAPDHQ
jgi:ribosomal protein S18 acetylase RimI-like enzyme